MKRVVTDEVVGELTRCLTKRRAERVRMHVQAQTTFLGGPVEYRVERKGFMRWAVVGYQAKLMPEVYETSSEPSDV